MISTWRQYKRDKHQLILWRHVQKHNLRLVENFEIDDNHIILDAIKNQISTLESRLKQFEDATSFEPQLCVKAIAQLPTHLVQLRMRLGVSQTELARRIGVSKQTISKHEKSHYRDLDLETVIKIAELLDHDLEELEAGELHRI